MYKADYHIHSEWSPDSIVPMYKNAERAIELGYDEVVFTDHMEMRCINGEFKFSMSIPDYLKEIEQLQDKYKDKIIIKKGAEIGYEPRWHNDILKFINPKDFDFIICSTHKCEKKDLGKGGFFDGRTQKEGYRRYFEEVLNTINVFDDFSVYGHIDFVNRYGGFVPNVLHISDYKDIIYEILTTLKDRGKGIEVNTSGIRYGLGHFNPQIEVLEMYKEIGGEIITIGSDSHYEEHLGCLWIEACKMLKNIGYKYIATFDKMEPVFKTI